MCKQDKLLPAYPAAGGCRHSGGFTLVELMAVMAIVGVLAAIAIPMYGQYSVKSRRVAAEAFMMDVASSEKQYFLDARAYALDPGALVAMGMALPAEVSANYTLSVAADTGTPSFIITATPIAGGRQDGDGALTLNDAGIKLPADKW